MTDSLRESVVERINGMGYDDISEMPEKLAKIYVQATGGAPPEESWSDEKIDEMFQEYLEQDVPKVRLTPKPGSDLWIVSEFVCPAGHVVQERSGRHQFEVSLRLPEKSLIRCTECNEWYTIVKRVTAVEADEKTIEWAREDGAID